MIKSTAFFLIFTFLTSCVSVRSNSKTHQEASFRKILVLLLDSSHDVRDSQRFLKACPEGYSLCTASRSQELAFDSVDSFITKENKVCQADVVMIVKRTGDIIQQNSYGATRVTGNEYSVELQTLPDQQAFWKASIRSEGTNLVPARTIFKRLIQDGWIHTNQLHLEAGPKH
ncbi:hypothetical protein [Siphonobacter sp. SORGH_AS_1065]|uniref:hypothetical protein n=1 Tax=Siphonobacter sp. SORGH_AS_1065 TaxID=3041795 RepID=UPI0027848838|nr:hypothetical protein [Siphonobacter sp. SORGH_AS_1065]MDQ1086590.1 hypothetical protein [Siphonobacter sp. SORGH_AS_1065]